MIKNHLIVWLLFALFTFPLMSRANEPPLIVKPKGKEVYEQQIYSQADIEPIPLDISAEKDFSIISSIHFLGGGAVELTDLAKVVDFLIHQPYSEHLLKNALVRVNQLYQEQGFALSYATIQRNHFVDGKLTITLVEGYIARTEIIADHPSLKERVAHILEPLTNERPLTQTRLDRAVYLLNQIPGYRFSIALPRPKTLSGATSIRAEVKNRQIFEPFIGFSSQKNADKNMSVGLHTRPALGYVDTFTVSGLVPLERQDNAEYYSVAIQSDWQRNGLKTRLMADYFSDENRETLALNHGEIDYSHHLNRKSISLTLSYPMLIRQDQQLLLKSSVLYEKESRKYDFHSLGSLNEKIHYGLANLYIDYYKIKESMIFFTNLGVNTSITPWFDYQSEINRPDRYDEDFLFYEANLYGSYETNTRWVMSFKANAIYSQDSLVSSQQPSYGGFYYGRGYKEGELKGDRGVGAEVKVMKKMQLREYYFNPYLVFDYAYVDDISPSILSHDDIASFAIGSEMGFSNNVNIALEYAEPMRDRDRHSGGIYNLKIVWQL
ncbi:POTRA domain-containing protein [Vibrio cincinnatiensis]|uniref:POTRA domain-containing protein n=1 Tax=Vibrio cincinnatiensis TaxID=675 RepID=UPI0012AC81B7|nr:POTRA domain-containing protein [Vibrio cincinnatiensis]